MTQGEFQRSGSGRIWYLEWLRVAACLAVVLIHRFSTILDNASVSGVGIGRALAWTELLVVFGRWAVPVFLMVTGALLLDPSRVMGWGKTFRYAGRMVAVLLVFGSAFALMEIVFESRSFSLGMVPAAFLRVFQERSWAHLWYLYDLIGVYLLLPLLRAFVAEGDEGRQATFLVVLLLVALVVPTLDAATGLGVARVGWLGSSVFYVLLGWYLHRFGAPKRLALAVGLACILVAVALAGLGIVLCNEYLGWVWAPSSPLIAGYSAVVFLMARDWAGSPRSSKIARLIAVVSSLSFAVYLMHPVVCNLLYKALGWASAPLPPVLFELTTYACVFFSSLVMATALKKVPLIGRML